MTFYLDPCPFCDSGKVSTWIITIHTDKPERDTFAVKCSSCLAQGPSCLKPEEAEKAWSCRERGPESVSARKAAEEWAHGAEQPD